MHLQITSWIPTTNILMKPFEAAENCHQHCSAEQFPNSFSKILFPGKCFSINPSGISTAARWRMKSVRNFRKSLKATQTIFESFERSFIQLKLMETFFGGKTVNSRERQMHSVTANIMPLEVPPSSDKVSDSNLEKVFISNCDQNSINNDINIRGETSSTRHLINRRRRAFHVVNSSRYSDNKFDVVHSLVI